MNTDKLNRDILSELANFEDDLCLTITLPTHVKGDDTEKNAIYFKNALQESQKKLENAGLAKEEIESFLKPLYDKLEDAKYWQHQGKGLIVLVSKNNAHMYRLAFPVQTNVIIDTHFYLRPVLGTLDTREEFALLLLSLKEPHIIFASHLEDHESEIQEIKKPTGEIENFESFLSSHDFEKNLQFSVGHEGAEDINFHGQGTSGDEALKQKYLDEYLKKLENWVYETLYQADIDDFFLVADEKVTGHYKNAMRDSHPEPEILEQKNPDSEQKNYWVQKAAKLCEKHQLSKELDVVSEYHQIVKTDPDKILSDIEDVVNAAHEKRIKKLIIPEDSQDYIWADYNPDKREAEAEKSDERWETIGEEMINLAAIQTYLNGGEIYRLPANENMPGLAAICRW